MEIQKLKEMILTNDIDLMTLACTIIVQKDLILPVFSIIDNVIPGKDSYYNVFSGWITIGKKNHRHLLVYKKNKGILIYYTALYIVDDVKEMLKRYNNELQSLPKERIIEYGKDSTNA